MGICMFGCVCQLSMSHHTTLVMFYISKGYRTGNFSICLNIWVVVFLWSCSSFLCPIPPFQNRNIHCVALYVYWKWFLILLGLRVTLSWVSEEICTWNLEQCWTSLRDFTTAFCIGTWTFWEPGADITVLICNPTPSWCFECLVPIWLH